MSNRSSADGEYLRFFSVCHRFSLNPGVIKKPILPLPGGGEGGSNQKLSSDAGPIASAITQGQAPASSFQSAP